MRGEIDQNKRRLWLQEAEEELAALLTAANRLRSNTPDAVQFRETYGIQTVKGQVKFQASALYGKLLDRTEIKLDKDLPQFVYVFTEGTIVDRFRLGTLLGQQIRKEIESLG